MYTNVFYQKQLYRIGGVETFLYELARSCHKNNRDLTIFYDKADPEQVKRIEPYCRILNINSVPKPIVCKKAFFNYNIEGLPYIQAEEYIQLIHADFGQDYLKNFKLIQSPKINKYYAVSENNAKSFNKKTGYDVEVIYNPIDVSDVPKMMTLVSAQRMSKEKGSKRIAEMIERLEDAKIPFCWHIFSETQLQVKNENVIFHKPTLDIRKWLKIADYTVLLSDSEGFPYTAYESLCLGTPLIITNLPILNELGCNNKNSIVVDFDLSNLDVQEIYNKAGTFKFTYKQKENKWLDLLAEGESDYEYIEPEFITLKAIRNYVDYDLNHRLIKKDTIYTLPEYLAKNRVAIGYAEYV